MYLTQRKINDSKIVVKQDTSLVLKSINYFLFRGFS